MRQKHEVRFLADIEKLARRIALGRLQTSAKIYEAIGRLKERYPRVARYYQLASLARAVSALRRCHVLRA